VPFRQVLKQ